MYKAGNVNIAPATITPEHAPIDCIITFCPMAFFFFSAPDRPTAMMAIGIAASNTCPTLRPRYAAAALNTTANISPIVTEYGVTSG